MHMNTLIQVFVWVTVGESSMGDSRGADFITRLIFETALSRLLELVANLPQISGDPLISGLSMRIGKQCISGFPIGDRLPGLP